MTIVEQVERFFQNMYESISSLKEYELTMPLLLSKAILEDVAKFLISPTKEEIRSIVFSFNPNKASVLDDFNSKFYQDF